ncbi:hypothetical protein OIU77_015051 [Salix suchowensis]|uniref:Uncharacterized protein n=1 Tax=Salix suchowensis TaxID=1278906 RepID=A0ABQ9A012_9ROSI|nr:hypothetical protein OIU77_015051 [Salix suchowensis]KAJ6355786.1 hypothetical protein OIU78_004000 [Salix suchowensis]
MITSLPLPFLHTPCSRASHVQTIRSAISSSSSPLTYNLATLPSLSLPHYSGSRIPLRRLYPIMSSAISLPEPIELREDSDFRNYLSSPDSNIISVCGFGSLLSERSARSTFPDLLNFRVARLNGFRRVFAHVAPIFFERGIAKPETKEISSLSVEPCEGESLVVTVFEIEKSEIPAFMERELEFRFLAVVPETLDGKPYDFPAVLCARYSDDEFFQVRCQGSKEIYFQHYGRYNIDKIWRDDILPCRAYLRHCVLAAKNLSDAAYDSFLDHTFLGDRQTTIREYLATTGAGIMEEQPPESLKTRYGG